MIRRGNYKLLPNYLINDDDWVLLFVRPSKVEQCINDLLIQVKTLKEQKVNPIIISAIFHINFILIHPLDDGNGRVARALSTLILLEKGLLPFNVHKDIKEEYSEALGKALNTKDYSFFIKFVLKQQKNVLEFLESGDYDAYINKK